MEKNCTINTNLKVPYIRSTSISHAYTPKEPWRSTGPSTEGGWRQTVSKLGQGESPPPWAGKIKQRTECCNVLDLSTRSALWRLNTWNSFFGRGPHWQRRLSPATKTLFLFSVPFHAAPFLVPFQFLPCLSFLQLSPIILFYLLLPRSPPPLKPVMGLLMLV